MKYPFTLRSINDKLSIEVNLADLYLVWGSLTTILLSTIISVSCIYTFQCAEFLPTISYLAAYSHYDRALVWVATAQIVPLLFFFISTFVVYSKHMSKFDSYTLLLISILVGLLFPSIIIVDEVNSSYYFPFDRLHVILLSALMLALGIWVLFSLEWLYKIHKAKPSIYIKRLAAYILTCFFSFYLSISQWKIAENPEDYLNLALKEYFSILLLTFLPRTYLSALKELKVSLTQGKLINIDE